MKYFISILLFSNLALASELKEQIRQTIKKSIPQILSCYKDHLKNDSGAAGKIVMAIEISSDGHLRSAHAIESKSRWLSNAGRGHESESLNQMATCIEEKMKPLHFPETKTTSTVLIEYPFVFGPR